jgi:hypothetical protein
VRQRGQEFVFAAIGRPQRFLAFAQGLFNSNTVGNVPRDF